MRLSQRNICCIHQQPFMISGRSDTCQVFELCLSKLQRQCIYAVGSSNEDLYCSTLLCSQCFLNTSLGTVFFTQNAFEGFHEELDQNLKIVKHRGSLGLKIRILFISQLKLFVQGILTICRENLKNRIVSGHRYIQKN